MKMTTDQNHPSDSAPIEQEVSRRTEKIAKLLGLDEQNSKVYNVISDENKALKKQLEDYHSQYNILEKRVKRLEKDIGSLEDELENLDEYVVEDLDECVNRETVIDLIHKIVPSLIGKKGPKGAVHKGSAYSSEFSEESDSVETYVVRERKAVPYMQRRRTRPRKVKRFVV